jgi:3-hydroxyisobutyrate dehydrogenase-like beta-hydroxyacid dehydrogenase
MGDDGIIAGLQKGGIWIDHSTTDYEQTKMFEELAVKKEAHTLEAPITGGLEALKKCQMAVWVAGDAEAYKKAKPVLDASYTTVMYTGALGTAMIPKVLSNMLCAVQVLAMSECFAIGNSHYNKFKTRPHGVVGAYTKYLPAKHFELTPTKISEVDRGACFAPTRAVV